MYVCHSTTGSMGFVYEQILLVEQWKKDRDCMQTSEAFTKKFDTKHNVRRLDNV